MPEASPDTIPDAELLIIGVTSPLLVGLYVDGHLVQRYERREKTSSALPAILHDVRYRYNLKALYYARGPGSFMAIKVTYVMAKTFSIALDIPLYASDAFAFNENRPIKAIGRSYFVKSDGEIVIDRRCDGVSGSFSLPLRLDRTLFSQENEPLYILPAV
ncbi:glycoprotease [Hydrogenimonas cancrithermarum]|uniref:Glycoprotease n=1 Tax=Hydrogenimonas cancrithermarum TaxID=2993563 RepID=A0ABM8FJT2_9BACT|nr:glycoprotease [Hydrogenimonas cancrithermarum]